MSGYFRSTQGNTANKSMVLQNLGLCTVFFQCLEAKTEDNFPDHERILYSIEKQGFIQVLLKEFATKLDPSIYATVAAVSDNWVYILGII